MKVFYVFPISTSNLHSSPIQYFKTISNKLHFDFQFLEFRHDNRKLFPHWTRIYPVLI